MAVDSQSELGGVNGGGAPAARVPGASRYDAAPVKQPEVAVDAGELYVEEEQAEAIPLDWQKIWLVLAISGVAFFILYVHTLNGLLGMWINDASWSHGFVVPLISIFLIRTKWDILKQLPLKGSFAGLVVLLIGAGGQVLFSATGTGHMTNLSMMVVLYGLVLFVFGWDHLRILWLPISFLIFMIPPPNALYVAMTTPMQNIAAELGVWLCPLFGIAARRSGVIFSVQDGTGAWIELTVAEACSGMRMLIAFFALAVALAYSTDRPMWQKLVLAICALPVAIFCNALRVAITGATVVWGGKEWSHGSTHEYVGLAMLIPAMGMQLGLAWLLDRVYTDEPEAESDVPATGGGA